MHVCLNMILILEPPPLTNTFNPESPSSFDNRRNQRLASSNTKERLKSTSKEKLKSVSNFFDKSSKNKSKFKKLDISHPIPENNTNTNFASNNPSSIGWNNK